MESPPVQENYYFLPDVCLHPQLRLGNGNK